MAQFRPDNPLRVSDAFIRAKLSGAFIKNVIIRSEAPGGVLEPEVLRFAESLIRSIEASPLVDRTVSFLD